MAPARALYKQCYSKINMKTHVLTVFAVLLAPLIAFAEGVSYRTEGGNLYSAGGSIAIVDDARNDIVAAGGDVSISGNAANEVLAAGGSLVLSGNTGGDARLAGGNVTVAGAIGGEAVLAGGKVHLLPKGRIGSGLIAGGGDITIEGTVDGSARIYAGTVVVNGTISRDLDIKADHIVIGRNARIGGNLRYEAPQEASIEQGAVIAGEKLFKQAEYERPRKQFIAVLGALWFIKVLAVLAAAVILYLLLPERTTEVTGLAVSRFGHELLVGFLVFVAVPALVLVLFITVLGWFAGLMLLVLYIAFLLLSSVFGALTFTRLVSGSLFKKPLLSWPLILAGVLAYQVLGAMPFLGSLFKFVFLLTALGSLSHTVYSMRRSPQALPPA